MHGVRGFLNALVVFSFITSLAVADELDDLAAKAITEIKNRPEESRDIVVRKTYESFLPESSVVVSSNVAGLFDESFYAKGFAASSINRPTVKWNRMPVTLPGHTLRHLYDPFVISSALNDSPEARDRFELAYTGTQDVNALVVGRTFSPGLTLEAKSRWARGPYSNSQSLDRENFLGSYSFKPDRSSDVVVALFASHEAGTDPNYISASAPRRFDFSGNSTKVTNQNAVGTVSYQRRISSFEVGASGYGGYHDFRATSDEKRQLFGGAVSGSFVEEGRETKLKTTFGVSADVQQGKAVADFNYRTVGFRLDQQIQWISWVRTEAGVGIENIQVTAADVKRDGLSVVPAIGITLSFDRSFDLKLSSSIENSLNDYRALGTDVLPFTRVMRYEGRIGMRLSRHTRGEIAVYGAQWEKEPVYDTMRGATLLYPKRGNIGLETRVATDASSWLKLSAALQIQKTSFSESFENGTAVPGVPGTILSANAEMPLVPRWSIQLGLKHIGDRPLTTDGAVKGRGYLLADAGANYGGPGWGFKVGAENLLNSEWNEMETVNATREAMIRPGLPLRATAKAYAYF